MVQRCGPRDGTEWDLGSVWKINLHNNPEWRYKFPLLAGECPVGEEVAGNLSEKFLRFGPALLMKRDNGGNLNHGGVNDCLSPCVILEPSGALCAA